MEMKLLKIQISSDILSKRGHPRIFEYISSVEIQNVLQYDPNDPKNLFLQAKIFLKQELNGNYKKIEEYETIKFLYVLRERGREILCLMSIGTEDPLWPDLGPLPWAVIPPLILDPHSLHITFIIPEKLIKALDRFLSRDAKSYEILAIENMEKKITDLSFITPSFSSRQSEIARFAYRNGYFETPKRISAKQIANHFALSTSTITKHLRIATEKAMKFFFL